MTIKPEEFKSYLAIDKNALDEELEQQPSLFYAVSEAYVEAIALRDTMKEKLAEVDAELDGKVRRNLERREDKVTEAMVKGAVQTHEDHVGAFDEYTKAKTQADTLGVLKEAFHQRSYMLRELCGLHMANYFERTSVKDTKATGDVKYERNRERLHEGRTRNRQ